MDFAGIERNDPFGVLSLTSLVQRTPEFGTYMCQNGLIQYLRQLELANPIDQIQDIMFLIFTIVNTTGWKLRLKDFPWIIGIVKSERHFNSVISIIQIAVDMHYLAIEELFVLIQMIQYAKDKLERHRSKKYICLIDSILREYDGHKGVVLEAEKLCKEILLRVEVRMAVKRHELSLIGSLLDCEEGLEESTVSLMTKIGDPKILSASDCLKLSTFDMKWSSTIPHATRKYP